MKRIFAAVLAAVMLLSSCTATPPEETSPADAAVEMGYLTGIYSTAAEAVADSVCTPILPSHRIPLCFRSGLTADSDCHLHRWRGNHRHSGSGNPPQRNRHDGKRRLHH